MKTFGIQVTLFVLLAAVAVLSTPLGADGEKGKTKEDKVDTHSSRILTPEETHEKPEVIEVPHRVKRAQNPWGNIGGSCPPCACGGGGWGASNPNRG